MLGVHQVAQPVKPEAVHVGLAVLGCDTQPSLQENPPCHSWERLSELGFEPSSLPER